jgi:hypothetical protein
MTTTPEMRTLGAAVAANIPSMLWGDPGCGKSATIESTFTSDGYSVDTISVGNREPSDFAGLPVLESGSVRLAAPQWVAKANEAPKALIFLDEFSQATPVVQGAVLRILNERQVGETYLGDHVRLILAGNPPESGAGAWDLTAPAANRMIHINWVGPTVDDFAMGLTMGWDTLHTPYSDLVVEPTDARVLTVRTLVATFLQLNPSRLHVLPTNPAEAGRGWASHRSWTMLASALPFMDADDIEGQLMLATGCVGEGIATEFVSWMRNADLPDPRGVLDDPSSFDWKEARLDQVFALSTAITTLATMDATEDIFHQAWACSASCADAGRADIAVTMGRRLIALGQGKRWMPKADVVKVLIPQLKAAGLLVAP